MSLVVTPDLFRLNLGPITGAVSFLGFEVTANALVVVEVASRTAVAMAHFALAASFDAAIGLGLGPLSVRITLSARFAYECTYLGGLMPAGGGSQLVLYGQTSVTVAASLTFELDLHIGIHIDCGFFSVDIDIDLHFSASLSLCFAASVEAAITTSDGVGLSGRGGLAVNLFGFKIDFEVPFQLGSGAAIGVARSFAQSLQRV
jgi:hypothetical protein